MQKLETQGNLETNLQIQWFVNAGDENRVPLNPGLSVGGNGVLKQQQDVGMTVYPM